MGCGLTCMLPPGLEPNIKANASELLAVIVAWKIVLRRSKAMESSYLGAQKKDKNVLRRSKTTTKTYLGAQKHRQKRT